jgi:oligopeptide transport system permease protein
MPVIALAALPMAYIARITRASMLEVLSEEYILTARSKGLREPVVLLRHAMRNALIPILTVAGPIAVSLVTGSFIVESFFSIPGIGRLFVQGVFARDYGVIMGATLFYALLVAVANLVVDLLYAVVDPRIRYG